MNLMSYRNIDLTRLRKNSGWLIFWGIALIVLGTLAISAATFTTLVTIMFLGFIILLSGIIQIIDSFASWWGRWPGFFTHILIGVLCTAVGLLLIESPHVGSISITLVLGVFYVLLGLTRIFFSSSTHLPRWKWVLFNGLISLLLGILILANLPGSGMLIIGLFVGIDLLFCGIAYLAMGFACRSLT